MGATPLTPTIQLDGKAGIVAKSKKFAVSAGCATEADWDAGDKFGDIMTCLRDKPIEDLVQVVIDSSPAHYWHPIVDGPGGILPKSLHELAFERPNVPFLTGANNDEYSWDLIVKGLVRIFSCAT